MKVTIDALQVLPGGGYTRDFRVERYATCERAADQCRTSSRRPECRQRGLLSTAPRCWFAESHRGQTWLAYGVDVGLDAELSIKSDGQPAYPLRCVEVDDWHGATQTEIAQAAAQVSRSLPLTVGIAKQEPPQRLRPLLEAMTVTLAGTDVKTHTRYLVTVADPQGAYARIADVVQHSPEASVACGQLLRQTPLLDTTSGLAAEAAVYSMLLGGAEFAAWLDNRGAPKQAPEPGRPLVRVTRDDGVLSIVLDYPERRNALSFRMREALFDAFEVATHDATIAQVELSGAGPAFCSGGDLAEFGMARDLVAAYLVRLDRAPWRLIDRLHDRVTARVQGAAVGAGIEMAAFAGRVVAATDTVFLLPEIPMGLVPGAGGTVSVTRRIGRWRAAWLMLSACKLDTRTALEWGLIDEIEQL